jgi:hypothetical protein
MKMAAAVMAVGLVVVGNVVRVNRLLEQTEKCTYVFLNVLC